MWERQGPWGPEQLSVSGLSSGDPGTGGLRACRPMAAWVAIFCLLPLGQTESGQTRSHPGASSCCACGCGWGVGLALQVLKQIKTRYPVTFNFYIKNLFFSTSVSHATVGTYLYYEGFAVYLKLKCDGAACFLAGRPPGQTGWSSPGRLSEGGRP